MHTTRENDSKDKNNTKLIPVTMQTMFCKKKGFEGPLAVLFEQRICYPKRLLKENTPAQNDLNDSAKQRLQVVKHFKPATSPLVVVLPAFTGSIATTQQELSLAFVIIIQPESCMI